MYRIRSHLKGIKYESYANVPEDFGTKGLDCSLGINPFGFPEKVFESTKIMNRDLIRHYPHGDLKLKNGIIKHWKDY
ncbi:MAG: hypothetical protein LR001_06570 [Clostridiales bacterium]|nr:hypothetical protein [Clostridiales bacterium]